MTSSIYQRLGASFCHDLASPINASGLLWEALDDSVTPQDREVAACNQRNLIHVLEFYRIFFAHKPHQHLFARVINLMQKVFESRGVVFKETTKDFDASDANGQILALLVYPIQSILGERDKVMFEQISKEMWTFTLWTTSPVPYDDLRIVLNTQPPFDLQRPYFAAHHELLKQLMTENKSTMVISREGERIEFAFSPLE